MNMVLLETVITFPFDARAMTGINQDELATRDNFSQAAFAGRTGWWIVRDDILYMKGMHAPFYPILSYPFPLGLAS